MSSEDVIFLHLAESVSLDAGAFQSLVLSAGAANAMAQADDLFEDFIVCLSAIESAWTAGEFDRLASQAAMLSELSDHLGLVKSAVIARQVVELIGKGDDVALAAVVARAVRVGEASLTSVLEFAYHRI